MPSIPQFVENTFVRMIFNSAVVSKVVHLSAHYRLIEIESESLKKVTWVPGQKIEFHLGTMVKRTYTPI